MIVKVIKLNENANIPFKIYSNDFCYDVVAVSEEEIAPNVWKYGTGLAFEIETPFLDPHNFSLDCRPRSSIYKTGMVLSNSCGTIDLDYRGEVSFIFYHVMPNLPRYKVGDKIGQIKLGKTEPLKFILVEALTKTPRGKEGFGSTGN